MTCTGLKSCSLFFLVLTAAKIALSKTTIFNPFLQIGLQTTTPQALVEGELHCMHELFILSEVSTRLYRTSITSPSKSLPADKMPHKSKGKNQED